jgi:hypothetical protein
MTVKIPFVDLKFQHQPIQSQLHQAIETVLTNGDFILGEASPTSKKFDYSRL